MSERYLHRYAKYVLGLDPLGYWRLAADASDYTEHERDGSNVGTPVYTGAGVGSPVGDDHLGGHVTMNGGDRVDTGLTSEQWASDLRAAADARGDVMPSFTVGIWVRPDATNDWLTALGFSNTADLQTQKDHVVTLRRRSPGGSSPGRFDAYVARASNSQLQIIPGNVVPAGMWAFILLVVDNSAVTEEGVSGNGVASLYVDGVLITQSGTVGGWRWTTDTPSGPVRIGTHGTGAGTHDWHGDLAELHVIGRGLTDAEAAALHRAGGPTYRQAVLDSGPIAYWPLDDAAGSTAAAELIDSADAPVVGVPVFGALGGVIGEPRATDFVGGAGSADRVETPASTNVARSDLPWSWEAWVWFPAVADDPDGVPVVMSEGDTGNHYIGWLYTGTQDPITALRVHGDNVNDVTFSRNFTGSWQRQRWYHFACTYDTDTDTLRNYVDGVEVASYSNPFSSGSLGPFTFSGAIGCLKRGASNISNDFSGRVQHVSKHQRVLTPTEIADHWHKGADYYAAANEDAWHWDVSAQTYPILETRSATGVTRMNAHDEEPEGLQYGIASIRGTTHGLAVASVPAILEPRLSPVVEATAPANTYRVVLNGPPPTMAAIGELVDVEIESFTDELSHVGSMTMLVGEGELLLDSIVELETEAQVWLGKRRMWWGVITRARGRQITARSLDFHFEHRHVGSANRRNWLRNGDFTSQAAGSLAGEPTNWAAGTEAVYPGSTRIWLRDLVDEDGVRYLRLRENRVNESWLRKEDDTPAPAEQSLLAYVVKERFWPGGLPRSIPGTDDTITQENRSVLVTQYKTPQDVAIYLTRRGSSRWPLRAARMGSPELLRRYRRYRVIEGQAAGEGWEITNEDIPNDFVVGVDALRFRQYAYTRRESFNQRISQSFNVSGEDYRMRPGQVWTLRGYYRLPSTPTIAPRLDRGAGFRLFNDSSSTANTIVEEWENIDLSTKVGMWHRFELEITIPRILMRPGFSVYLYAPVGEIHWRGVGVFHRDALYHERARPLATSAAKVLVAHAQDPAYGKSDLRVGASGGGGGRTDLAFYHDEHQQIDQAWESLALLWRFDHSSRRMQFWEGRSAGDDRGDVLIDELVADQVEILPDGAGATSSVVAMSSYSGPAREEGFAIDAGAFGGVVYEKVVASEETTYEGLNRVAAGALSTGLPTLVVALCQVDRLPLDLASGDVVRFAVSDGVREVRGPALITKLEWLPNSDRVRVEANVL